MSVMAQRFGVICDDLRAAPVLRALISRPQPVVLCAVRTTLEADGLFHDLRGVEFCQRWEELLPDTSITDVLVGGGQPETLVAAKHLAQAGKTVWVLPHPQQGLMFAYEVSLQLEEGQGLVAPVFPDRARAWWQQLLQAAREGWLPPIQYIEFERFLDAGRRGMSPRSLLPLDEETGAARPGSEMSVSDVEARLLWDLDLVRRLVGRYNRATTLRTGGENGYLRQQTVTLTGSGVPELVWTVKPRSADSVDRLTLHTAEGAFVLEERPDGVTAWRPHFDAVSTVTIRSDLDVLFPTEVTAAAWRDAVEAFELADAVQHSLERRRTVDLHHEPVSERTIFKTQMTALGCAVLFGTLVLMVGYLAIASIVPLNGTLLVALRTLVFAPLVLFLIAQLLLPLTRASKASRDV